MPIKVVTSRQNNDILSQVVLGKGRVTTVAGILQKNKANKKPRLLRVLLDSGSDGDLMFDGF